MTEMTLERPGENCANGAADDAAGEPLHVVWVNQHADWVGGAESYIQNVVDELRLRGVRNTLLYAVEGAISTSFVQRFDRAFPMVDVANQIASIGADIAYAHRVEGADNAGSLTSAGIPAVRFFHDHKLFCLREHKYTAVGNKTCSQRTGLGCYGCLGFVQRADTWPGVRLASIGRLHREQQANQGFDAFVVGSSYMKEHVACHGFDRDRIHTLPLFVDSPVEYQSATPRKQDEFLFVGSLVRGKGVDLILRALHAMRNQARLVIAGEGRQESELRRLADLLGLGLRVEFTGRLNRGELASRMRRATCLVAPSRSPETFGLAGLEAMSYGAPVIGSDVGGMSTWLRHETTGLAFPSGDYRALAAAMDRMIDEPEMARGLGEAARLLQQSSFQKRDHVDSLLHLFRQLTVSQEAAK